MAAKLEVVLDFVRRELPGKTRPSGRHLARCLRNTLGNAQWPNKLRLPVERVEPRMLESPWPVPPLHNPAELALWCGTTVPRLSWMADPRGMEAKTDVEKCRNFRYHFVKKPVGLPRLIESPKPQLKAIQRRILDRILGHLPPHQAAHGFVPGRDVRSFTAPHVKQGVVLRMDLQNFFASIHRARVSAIFRRAGYPPAVERLLAGLVTNVPPASLFHEHRALRDVYYRPHLPQGSPSSPALANLVAYHLDRRLAAYTAACGGVYTRYADDLAFSGSADFARQAEKFLISASRIVLEEGFTPNFRKLRLMRPGVRQCLAGMTLNEKPNLRREDFDHLKAILHDAARHGAAHANRRQIPEFRAHLLGKISWWQQINPQRGAKLQALFDRISDWGRP